MKTDNSVAVEGRKSRLKALLEEFARVRAEVEKLEASSAGNPEALRQIEDLKHMVLNPSIEKLSGLLDLLQSLPVRDAGTESGSSSEKTSVPASVPSTRRRIGKILS